MNKLTIFRLPLSYQKALESIPVFAPATEKYGDYLFGANDLSLPNVGAGKRLTIKSAANGRGPRCADNEPDIC